MKNASNHRRGRGRNSSKRNQNSRGSGADNDGKIRGSAQQVLDKYLALARDATSFGDRIAAEGYFQHAEHYQRVINISNDNDNAKKINISEKSNVNPESSESSDKNSLSRTERATNARNERLNNKYKELEKN